MLPAASRFFEKTIFDQLYAYIENNKLFHSHQSGFRTLHTVLTCLLKSSDDWYLSTSIYRVVFIDLKKAFDTVDHAILIQDFVIMECRERNWIGLNRTYLIVSNAIK